MRAGSIVRDGRGRYWRCHSVFYAPGYGIRINLDGPCRSMHTLLSRFMDDGGVVVRRPGTLDVNDIPPDEDDHCLRSP